MYSCEKCKKLRNGIRFSKVIDLPEVLCIHLKRFRHEYTYPSKVSTHVSFPLKELKMSMYIEDNYDTNDEETSYDLFSCICHHGSPSIGHYTCYALNSENNCWYEYDDQYVNQVEPSQVSSAEAYVLFYQKK